MGQRAQQLALLAAMLLAASCGKEAPPTGARNVLLVTIDTLRADRLGAWGYGRDTSPAIDALAARSVLFENATVQTAWTLPSLASLLTSLHSSSHGAWTFDSRLGDAYTTLAERLDAAGYASFGVASHVFLDEPYGLQQGFEAFDTSLVRDFVASHEAVTSEQVTRRGIEWLAARSEDPRPWLLWLHYFDPHASYRIHEGVSDRFGTRSDSQRYDGEVAFTDRAIGEVLDFLSQSGLADDTLIVLVADHGEEFGEHGGEGHGRTLHREVVHVPLLIHVPGLAPRRVSAPVTALDVQPTLLELLGLEAPVRSAGRSLVPMMLGQTLPEKPLLAELGLNPNNPIDSLTLGPWKLLRQRRTGRNLLFDVVSDPGEQDDLAARRPDVVEELLPGLEREVAEAIALGDGLEKAAPLELSDEELERLRALGYLDPP